MIDQNDKKTDKPTSMKQEIIYQMPLIKQVNANR